MDDGVDDDDACGDDDDNDSEDEDDDGGVMRGLRRLVGARGAAKCGRCTSVV